MHILYNCILPAVLFIHPHYCGVSHRIWEISALEMHAFAQFECYLKHLENFRASLVSRSVSVPAALLLYRRLIFCFCFLHKRKSGLAVKTKLCFLNDTSALGTLGQQPPDVCKSYFRHKSVSVRATALFSNPTRAHTHTFVLVYYTCKYSHGQNALKASPQPEPH